VATRYHIHEIRNGLLISVTHQSVWWEQVLAAGIVGAAVWLASVTFLDGRWKLVTSVLVAILSFAAVFRPRYARLTITNVEFLTRGNFSTRFRAPQTVCTGDVRWLEYQEGSRTEDSSHDPGGLYAAMIRGKACLLPFLTEVQTNQLIVEIEKRFPGLAERWRAESPFNTHFLAFELAKAK
jgi:hypothetical protein